MNFCRAFSCVLSAMSLLLLFTGTPGARAEAVIRHFQTDGCTDFPDGTSRDRLLWRDCCVQHDLYLWAGGTEDERLDVDRQLKECVISKGAPVPAWVMYLGVRIGSRSPIRYKEMEWGNAWNAEGAPPRPRYQALTADEVNELERDLLSHPSISADAGMVLQFFSDLEKRVSD